MSMKVRSRLEECLCGGVTVDIEDTIWHFAKRESADRFLISRGFEQAGWRAGEDEVTDLERLVKADFEANPPYDCEEHDPEEHAIEGLDSSVAGPSTVSSIDW
jgi:hypothetical protein